MPKIPCGCGRDECELEVEVPNRFLGWLRRRSELVVYHLQCPEVAVKGKVVRPKRKEYDHPQLFGGPWLIGVSVKGVRSWRAHFQHPEFTSSRGETLRRRRNWRGGRFNFLRNQI